MKKGKGFIATLLVGVLSLSFSTGAFAATETKKDVNVQIQGGEFSLATSDIATFGNVTLKDQPVTYNTSFNNKFTVKDLRGTQAGWRLDVSATPFTDGKNTLPKGSLSLTPLSSINRVGVGQGAVPVKTTTSNKVIDDGAVTYAKANAGGGMGVFDMSFPQDALSVVIDPTTAKLIDTSANYKSTLTWNLVQAP